MHEGTRRNEDEREREEWTAEELVELLIERVRVWKHHVGCRLHKSQVVAGISLSVQGDPVHLRS